MIARRLVPAVAVALGVVLGAVACSSGDGGASPPVSELGAAGTTSPAVAPEIDLDLREVAAEVIVPRYEAFSREATELVAAVDQLCASPSSAALEAARAQWEATRAAWRRTTAFGVGPVMELRTMAAVDFATSSAKVEEVVTGDAPLTAASVANLGANARGLGAVEQLLFGDGAAALSAPAAGGPGGERRCRYAAAVSELVATAATAASDAWTAGAEPYQEQLGDDARTALNDLFNEVVRTLQGVADQKLALALGDTSGEPEPDKADPGPAQRALPDMLDDLDGVLASYDAVLHAAIARQSGDAATRARAQLVAGVDGLRTLEGPLATAVEADPTALTAAQASLKEAKRTLATEVASLLGLTLAFSDADGDS